MAGTFVFVIVCSFILLYHNVVKHKFQGQVEKALQRVRNRGMRKAFTRNISYKGQKSILNSTHTMLINEHKQINCRKKNEWET